MHSDQHFLVDEKTVYRVCEYAKIKKDEKILEIGAGTGNLTEKLLQKGAFVFAIEDDLMLVEKLKTRFEKEKKLTLIEGDALKLQFPETDKVVSSLPFSISRKITEKMLMHDFKFAILIYQREFAEKLVAKKNSSEYRFISALSQSCAEIEILESISPNAFEPVPSIVSSIVQLKQTKKADKRYVEFLHLLFNHRNKRLGSTLKGHISERFKDKRVFELSAKELVETYTEFYA